MKLLLQVPAGFLLLLWPMAVMMSPMAFDAPGSTSNKSALLPVVVLVFYPALIGIAFYLLNWSFLFFSPRAFLIVSISLPAAAFAVFGYPRIIFNMYRGVDSIGYCAKETAVYFNGAELEGADPGSFAVLEGGHGAYARDRAHVFYNGAPVQEADSSSFAPVLDGEKPSGFWRDASHVFYDGTTVADADPTTFEVFAESLCARDRDHVYYQGALIQGADRASLSLLSTGFARDKARIYFFGEPILPGADAASFELLEGDDYGRDASKVYALPNGLFATAHEVVGADRATFTSLDRGYAKDANHVYYPEERRALALPNADAATFKVTQWDQASGSEARDQSHFFMQGKVVHPSP